MARTYRKTERIIGMEAVDWHLLDAAVQDMDVFIYYWDDRNPQQGDSGAMAPKLCLRLRGWWFGDQVGGTQAALRSFSNA